MQRGVGGVLLEQLVDPWDVCFGLLKAYKEAEGGCDVPKRYVTAEGFNLGAWVGTQRQKGKGKLGGHTETQRARLEELEFVWDPLDAAWEEGLRPLCPRDLAKFVVPVAPGCF